jgi:hypothetical protein
MTDTQTTGAMSAVDVYVAFSTDGTTWVDVSGTANSVQVSGGERVTGTAYTFAGDGPVLKSGKKGPITLTVKSVYDENTNNSFQKALTAYDTAGGGNMYVRWSPGGGDSGDFGYTSSVGIVKSCVYPSADVTSGEPIMTEVVIECASVTKSAIGTAGW